MRTRGRKRAEGVSPASVHRSAAVSRLADVTTALAAGELAGGLTSGFGPEVAWAASTKLAVKSEIILSLVS